MQGEGEAERMELAQKIKIQPTEEQEEVLTSLSEMRYHNEAFPIARTLCERAIVLHGRYSATNRLEIRPQANAQTLAGSPFLTREVS